MPENVMAAHEDDPTRFYAYRPRDLIVGACDASFVAGELERRVGRANDNGRLGQLVKFLLPEGVSAMKTLADIRGVMDPRRRGSVNLNVIMSLGYHGGFHCPHPPRPAEAPPPSSVAKEAGSGIRVGLIDTGVAEHSELEEHLDRPADGSFDVPNENHSDMLHHGGGHGTFAAGLILRNAPGATIVPRRWVESDGLIDDWTLAEALGELAGLEGDKKIDMINLSFGGHTPDDMGLPATAEALRLAFAKNPSLVVVAAAGNDHSARPFYPAAHKQVVSVGALDSQGERAWFSNYGPWVDACAPGVDVVSTFLDKRATHGQSLMIHRLPGLGPQLFDGHASWSGSSFTAPQVTGAIAAKMSGRRDGAALPGPQAMAGLAADRAATPVPQLGVRIPTDVFERSATQPAAAS
ncbi:MAG: S8/S53 family peptidase [Actinomycetota bacterium]|nr:S8/S53 family peptidase [Actinomycetota bacterium]